MLVEDIMYIEANQVRKKMKNVGISCNCTGDNETK